MKAKACFERALAIAVEIGNSKVEALSYHDLGIVCQPLDDHDLAEEYLEKALSTSKDIGDPEIEFSCYCNFTLTKLSQKNFEEAFSFLFRSIEKLEEIGSFLQDNDQIKISLADKHVFPYQKLSELFCDAGNPKDALNVAELGRARA